MATVVNNGYPDRTDGARLDRSFCIPNRNNAGTPVGALTPQFSGELVLDTTNGIVYKGMGTTANTQWMPTYYF
jgi:hypothetical protein